MQNVSVYPEEIKFCVRIMGKENAISSLFTALIIANQKILAGI